MDCFDEAGHHDAHQERLGAELQPLGFGIASWQLGRYDQTIEDFTVGLALADEAG
ncbi:MAG: hypothetical protein R2844_19890 [Caldilineales bacterium]